MKTERLLRADGIIYGNVKEYYEDEHLYTFSDINGRKLMFPKTKYKLNKTAKFYDMEFIWLPSYL